MVEMAAALFVPLSHRQEHLLKPGGERAVATDQVAKQRM